MIISEPEQNIILQDTVRIIQDTTSVKTLGTADSAVLIKIPDHSLYFPFTWLEKNGSGGFGKTEVITSNLREGRLIEPQPFDDDWIVVVALAAAFIYATLSALPGRLFQNIKSFLLFKGIGDPSSRERKGAFHWHPILINLVSFSASALFAYCLADYYNFNPFGVTGFLLWVLFLGLLLILVFIRRSVCVLMGSITGEREVFGEYGNTIYNSYHISGFVLFLLSVLILYTTFPAPRILMMTGIVAVSAAYLIRVLRLLLIFLKRNISILYFILYLCALEFLPVLVVLKYLTDLF